MSSMLRQHHVRIQDLARYVRGFDPSKTQSAEEWSKQESGQFDPGMLIFCLERVLAPQGLAFGKRDDGGETYKVRDLCVVVGRDNGRPLVVNITASAYELRFLEVLLLEKARKAILDGKEFVYVAAQPSQSLTEAKIREIEGLGAVYAQGGSRRTLVAEGSTVQEPATALLSSLGVKLVQSGIGKQVLDIGAVCHMLFTPESRQDDRNKTIVKQSFIPVPSDSAKTLGVGEDHFVDQAENRYAANAPLSPDAGAEAATAATLEPEGSSAGASDPGAEPFAGDLKFSFERTEISTDSSSWKPHDSGQGYSFPTSPGPSSFENQVESRRLDPSLMKEVTAAVDSYRQAQEAQASPVPLSVPEPAPPPTPVPSPAAEPVADTPFAGDSNGGGGSNNGEQQTAAPASAPAPAPAPTAGREAKGPQTLFERLSEQFAKSMQDDDNAEARRTAPSFVQMGSGEAQSIFSNPPAQAPAPPAVPESSFPHFQSSLSAASLSDLDSSEAAAEWGSAAGTASSPSAFSALGSGSGFSPVPQSRQDSYTSEPYSAGLSDSSVNAWTPPPVARSGDGHAALLSGTGYKPVGGPGSEPTEEIRSKPTQEVSQSGSEYPPSSSSPSLSTDYTATPPAAYAGTDYGSVSPASSLSGVDFAAVAPPAPQSSGTDYAPVPNPATLSGTDYAPVPKPTVSSGTDYAAVPPVTAYTGTDHFAVPPSMASGAAFEAIPPALQSGSENLAQSSSGGRPVPASNSGTNNPPYSSLFTSGTQIPAVPRSATDSGTAYGAAAVPPSGTEYGTDTTSQSGTSYGAIQQDLADALAGVMQTELGSPTPEMTPSGQFATAPPQVEPAPAVAQELAQSPFAASPAVADTVPASELVAAPADSPPAVASQMVQPDSSPVAVPPLPGAPVMTQVSPAPAAASAPAAPEGMREGTPVANNVFQEPKLVMSEMATLMNRLEQQVAKAGKKLNGRAEEIKQRLNLAVAELVSSAAEVEKGSQNSITNLSAKQTKKLDDVSEEVRVKISDVAANGRYTIKQLLQMNQSLVEDSKNGLYESLKEVCKQFRDDTETLTKSGEEKLNKLVANRTAQLEVLVGSIVIRLDDTGEGHAEKLQARFERFRERMSEEAASVVRSLERNVRSMTEEIDGSWDRASDKLKSSKAEFELTIHHSVRTSQLNISSTTRRILSETLIPKLRERRASLRNIANELSRKFAVESDRQANGQLLGLESSLGAARQQLQLLVEECISSIDMVGRAQQAGLEEIFRETSLFAEKATADVAACVQRSELSIRETEAACKSLAETSNLETDSDLSEERNSASVRVQQLRQHATMELTSAIETGCARLEQLSQRVQSDLSNGRMESTQAVRDAAENGLNRLRDAIQEALSAIQGARDKYME